jgi:hypothetical protein
MFLKAGEMSRPYLPCPTRHCPCCRYMKIHVSSHSENENKFEWDTEGEAETSAPALWNMDAKHLSTRHTHVQDTGNQTPNV